MLDPESEAPVITNDELAAWLAGEADPAVAARVESALPGDSDLAARVERIRAADELLASMPDAAPSDDAVQRIAMAAQRDASNHLDLEAAKAGVATDGRPASSPSGWAGIDWTGWTARAAALAAIFVLVAVGVGLERGTVFGTRLTGNSDDSADGEGSLAAADDATEEMAAESLELGDQDSATAAMPEAGADAPEAVEEAEAATGTEAAADTAQAQALRTAPGGRISDETWATIVGDDVPSVLATPDGDVLLLGVGSRLDLLLTAADQDDASAEADESDTVVPSGSEAAFLQPATTIDPATVQAWGEAAAPDAQPVDPGTIDPGDDVSTTPELAADCLARRGDVVADANPPAAEVEVVVAGNTQAGAVPLQAFVDVDGGIAVVDPTTCEPL